MTLVILNYFQVSFANLSFCFISEVVAWDPLSEQRINLLGLIYLVLSIIFLKT